MTQWGPVHVYRSSAGRPGLARFAAGAAGNRPARILGPLLLLAVTGAVIGLVLATLPSGRTSRTATRRAAITVPHAATRRTAPAQSAPAQPRRPTSSTRLSAIPATLQARGHALLVGGSITAAIPLLRQAIAATGESVGACLQPRGANCFTYAYALYDLGRALRLSGDTAAAIPILEQRLRINDHRRIVAAELQLALQGVR
jgi:tetratricopeptide (TPR) repeat protein